MESGEIGALSSSRLQATISAGQHSKAFGVKGYFIHCRSTTCSEPVRAGLSLTPPLASNAVTITTYNSLVCDSQGLRT